jgi:hypothetical protein
VTRLERTPGQFDSTRSAAELLGKDKPVVLGETNSIVKLRQERGPWR